MPSCHFVPALVFLFPLKFAADLLHSTESVTVSSLQHIRITLKHKMFDNHLIIIGTFVVHHSDPTGPIFQTALSMLLPKEKKEKSANMLHQQIVLFRTQNKLCDSGSVWR